MAKAVISIIGKNTSINQAVKQTQSRLNGLRKGLVGAFSGAIIGGGLIATLEAARQKFDRIQKISQRGFVNTEFLQKVGFAAEQSGSDMETVSKAVSRLQRSLGEADESPAIAKAFENIGINIKTFQELIPEEQFYKIAEATKEGGINSEKYADLVKLMGRNVDELLPLLSLGSDGIKDIGKDVNSLTDEQQNNIAIFNDWLNLFKTNVTSIAGEFIGTLVGMFKNAGLIFDNLIEQTAVFIETIGKALSEPFGEGYFERIKEIDRKGTAEQEKLAKKINNIIKNGAGDVNFGSKVNLDKARADIKKLEDAGVEIPITAQEREDIFSALKSQTADLQSQFDFELSIKDLDKIEQLQKKLDLAKDKAQELTTELAQEDTTQAQAKALSSDLLKNNENILKLTRDIRVEQKKINEEKAQLANFTPETAFAEIEADLAQKKLATEEKIKQALAEQNEIRKNLSDNYSLDERKEKIERIKELELENIANKENAFNAENEARLALAEAEKKALKAEFANVDDLRDIGGSLGGVNYDVDIDGIQEQLSVQKQTLEEAKKTVEAIKNLELKPVIGDAQTEA